ncbi:MAG: fumarylacetoacetate hydrolase family protein [Pseudomonadota bacterium]
MTSYVFPPAAHPAVPVEGGDVLFPVGRIICVAKNYRDHRIEMGGDDRKPPFFFMKPASALTPSDKVPFPADTENLHYEGEFCLALGPAQEDRSQFGRTSLFGTAVGVDLTRRDRQAAAKENGHPWERAKAFPGSAPIGMITRCSALPSAEATLSLSLNGEIRQSTKIGAMIWSASEILAEINAQFGLMPGDIIYTGTPAGVGPLVPGDRVEVAATGCRTHRFQMIAAPAI